jgi:hypothetical protein
MGKIIRLTESELTNLVRRVIMEENYDTKCITPVTPKDVIDVYKNILSKGYVCDGIVENNKIRVRKNIGSGVLYVYIYKVSYDKYVKLAYYFKSPKKQKEAFLKSSQQLYDIENELSKF